MKKYGKIVKPLCAVGSVLAAISFLFMFAGGSCFGSVQTGDHEPVLPDDAYVRDIPVETEDRYSFVGSSGVTIDGEYHSYSEAVREISDDDIEDGYDYWTYVGEDETIFLYELHNYDTGSGVDAADGFSNGHTFDIGLYGMDHKTGGCTLYNLYENVYPSYRYRYTHENIVAAVDDEADFVILFYNGKLEVYDTKMRSTVYSRRFFADDEFKDHYNETAYNSRVHPYAFTSGHDLLIHRGDTVELYLYNDAGGYSARPQVFDFDGGFDGAESLDDIVFVYCYGDTLHTDGNFYSENRGRFDRATYGLIYDTAAGRHMSADELIPLLEAEAEEIYAAGQNIVAVGEERYEYEETPYEHKDKYGNGSALKVTRLSDGAELTITIDLLAEKSPAYSEIVSKWDPRGDVYVYPDELFSVNGKLFVCCGGRTPGIIFGYWDTPAYLFEADFDTGDMDYVGFSSDYNFVKLVPLPA